MFNDVVSDVSYARIGCELKFLVGRRNWLFAGADTGAETLACAMTIIETAKMNGLNPQAYLADVLAAFMITKSIGSMNCFRGIGCLSQQNMPW